MALSVYKKGQGNAARGVAGVVAVLMGSWAGHQMWMYGAAGLGPTGRSILTAIVVLVFGGAPLSLILFHRSVVDLMIETQQEMRKVAWSSRSEVAGAATIVIATVAVLSIFILLVDLSVQFVFQFIGLY
ncbi:preprotein translocase subunit SecE [bacterium]|nr:preprotein translocase subunit SecE [bacterium]